MKKLIALCILALVMLVNFAPAVSVAEVNEGVMVCSDLKPNKNPHDDCMKGLA